jgi:hypothetical protein
VINEEEIMKKTKVFLKAQWLTNKGPNYMWWICILFKCNDDKLVYVWGEWIHNVSYIR